MVSNNTEFCFTTDRPTLADCFLLPQMVHARRLKLVTANFRVISNIEARLYEIEDIRKAMPKRQAGYPNY